MKEKKPRVASTEEIQLSAFSAERGVLSKGMYISDPMPQNRGSVLPEDLIQRQLDKVANSGNFANSVKVILSDLGVAEELVVSHIINPNDFTSADIDISSTGTDIPEETLRKMLEITRAHFKDVVKINERIPEMISQAMFDRGAYCLLILPPESVRELVLSAGNESLAALEKRISNSSNRILNFRRDTLLSTLGLDITDDPIWLLKSEIAKKKHEERTKNMYGAGLEAVYHGKTTGRIRLTPPDKIGSDANAFIKAWPMDCVLPLTEPGVPDNPLGYYLVTDERGQPLSAIRDIDHVAQLSRNTRAGGSVTATAQHYAKEFGLSGGAGNADYDASLLLDEYIQQVERTLQAAYGDDGVEAAVSVPRIQEVYSLMLSRAIAKKRTRVVYVDKDVMLYAAYQYNELGVGVSKLEETKLFSSIRIALLFADLFRSVKNAMGMSKVNIVLDEKDPNKVATVERVKAFYGNMQNSAMPISDNPYSGPGDVVRSLHQASTLFSIDGGTAFPGTKLDVVEEQRNLQLSDDAYEEKIRKMQYNRIGIPPEYVDQALVGDFATSITTNTKLFAKRVRGWQTTTKRHGTRMIQLCLRWSGKLVKELALCIGDNDAAMEKVSEFIGSLEMNLPEPDVTRIAAHAEAYGQMKTLVTDVVEDYINEDMYEGILTGDNASNLIRGMKSQLISAIMREWMHDQNILPEIGNILDLENSIGFDEKVVSHFELLAGNFANIMKTMGMEEFDYDQMIKKANDKLEEKKAKAAERDNSEEQPVDGEDPVGADEEPNTDVPDDDGGDGAPEDAEGGDTPPAEDAVVEDDEETPPV